MCERLGRSTDEGDAVVMAWYAGAKRLYQGRLQGGRNTYRNKPEVTTAKSRREMTRKMARMKRR